METNMIIKLGDKHQVEAKKKGVVQLGDVEIKVFIVPEFRISLLSVGQADSYGYVSTFKSGICSITNAKGSKVLSAIVRQGLYLLSTDGSAHELEIRLLRTGTKNAKTLKIWHQRFAHLNYHNLKRILNASHNLPTDAMDVGPVRPVEPITTDDTDATDATDAADSRDIELFKPVATDAMDVELVKLFTSDATDATDTEPVAMNAIDVDIVMPGSDPIEKCTDWGTAPRLCETCIHTKQQQKVTRTKTSGT